MHLLRELRVTEPNQFSTSGPPDMKKIPLNQKVVHRTRASKVVKPLLLALASLALSAIALPAAADDIWWTATPHVVFGTTTIDVRTMGALGDGQHNDTAAFQAAINALPNEGGTVTVPAGRYMIDAVKSVQLRSHTRLLMDATAELDAIPNSSTHSIVVKAWRVTDVRIVGGNIVGERVKHMGTTGEWGYGINISGSTSVVVKNVNISNCWGDGLWVGATGAGTTLVRSDYVTLNGVVSSNNRRQGLSIGPAQHVYVVNSTFRDTNGTLPEAGIDIEPMTQGPADTIRIENTVLSGNHGNGLELHANISNIVLNHNTMTNNHGFGAMAIGAPNLIFTANNATQNGLAGMSMSGTTHEVNLDNNALTYNSTRYMSPTRPGGGLTRDLQIGTKTWAIYSSVNTFSP